MALGTTMALRDARFSLLLLLLSQAAAPCSNSIVIQRPLILLLLLLLLSLSYSLLRIQSVSWKKKKKDCIHTHTHRPKYLKLQLNEWLPVGWSSFLPSFRPFVLFNLDTRRVSQFRFSLLLLLHTVNGRTDGWMNLFCTHTHTHNDTADIDK